MSTIWLKNFAGLQQSEADIQSVPNALVELGIHITCKTIQVGTLLGSVIGPIIALARKTCPKTGLIKGGSRGAVIGALLGPVVTVATTRGKTEPEITDRCYRLRHNEGQLWVDRSFVVAVTLGFMAAGTVGLVAGINGAVIVTPLGRAAWHKMSRFLTAAMSSYWFKNFAGLKQTDFEMIKVPNAGAEFCIHVTLRSIQTGALLGSVLGPLSVLAFKDGRAQAKSVRDAFVEGGRNGALIGAAIGPVLTYMALRDMSSAKLYDKCYRLRFDREQLWLDRSCVISAAVGLLSNGSAGMVVGMDIALLFHSIGGMVWGK